MEEESSGVRKRVFALFLSHVKGRREEKVVHAIRLTITPPTESDQIIHVTHDSLNYFGKHSP